MAEEVFVDNGVAEVEETDDVAENTHPSEEEVPEPQNDPAVVSEEKKWPGWPGENIFRLLVPVQKVGGIIGRKGELIKRTCEETKARIKILEGPPGATERPVLISAKEEPDLPISPAMDGLLTIHQRIIDTEPEAASAQSGKGRELVTRLLVAASQAGSLIGKQGATIKSIQDSSSCTVRVLGGENLPVFALPDDSVVEIHGEPTEQHKALELIATHLRKFLADRSVVGIFEMQMLSANTQANQNLPPQQQPWGPPSQGYPMNVGGGGPGFGPGFGAPPNQYMPPARPYDNYYAPQDVPPFETQPRPMLPPYGNDPSVASHTTNLQPQSSMVTKVTKNMQISLSFADAVIGTSGANISYIRRASGATIAIQESRGAPDEMTVEINGTATQVQAAQQLIQNFMADAAAAAAVTAQNTASAQPPGQGYNPYAQAPPSVYGSQPTGNTAVYAPPAQVGDYNPSVYGANYGYQ